MIRVLHVDDDPDELYLVRTSLERLSNDLKIEWAEDAAQALEIARSGNCDCVLSDYKLPGMDGMKLLEALREQGNETPFIFLTGQGSEEVAAKALRSGADDYYTKKGDFAHYERLLNSIQRVVDASKMRQEKNLAEEALKRSRFSLATAERLARIGHLEWDIERDELRWSEGADQLLGRLPKEEVNSIGKCLALIHPEDRVHFETILRGTLQEKSSFCVELRICLPDGEERMIHAAGEVVVCEEGRPIKLIGTVCDITDIKQTRIALEASEERLTAILKIAAIVIISFDEERRITLFNKAAEEFFGYGADEVLGEPLDMLLPRNFCRNPEGYIRRFAASPDSTRFMGDRAGIEGCLRDGGRFLVEASISKVEVGGRYIFTVIMRDLNRTDCN